MQFGIRRDRTQRDWQILQGTVRSRYRIDWFEKIKAPKEMFDLIKHFWIANKDKNDNEWGQSVNTYYNMWSSPLLIVNIQEERQGNGLDLTTKVWEAARLRLEKWTGMHLSPCSIWGIYMYHNNLILTTHVDRNPLVTSAIINVA